MSTSPYPLVDPAGPCPRADNPEAVLLWLYWRHLGAGRIERRREHADPFWRRVDEKRRDRLRLAARLRADPAGSARVQRLADLLDLDLAGLDDEERIEAVSAAVVPLRFHIGAALAELGEHGRAAEVLATTY